MARPWARSNDFRIAIAMKVALTATPGAGTDPFSPNFDHFLTEAAEKT
jgi:hypothetical protein